MGAGVVFFGFCKWDIPAGAFIFEKTKNKAKRTCSSGGVTYKTLKVTKSVFVANQPRGACGILRLIAEGGRANSLPWLTALYAPSLARRPPSSINLKTD